MKIIVDAMGGDNAPLEIIKGAMLALDEFDEIDEIIFTGDEDKINESVKENGIKLKKSRIVNCTQEISMCDEPASVLKEKPDSSMAVGFKLLSEGEGDAFVSAGNTGAITVGATLIIKRIKGIKRPAIASLIPGEKKPFLLLDCGANSDCRAEFLYQFGYMGSLYMKSIMKCENPTVALANNGSEDTKGNALVKETFELMKGAPYNFIGSIEGRQIPFGDADVVVADGFSGNLILKTYEGAAKVLMESLENAFNKNILSKLSYLGVKSSLNDMKTQFDYREYGGAVLLGIKKPVIKSHGSADAKTFKNAIKQAVWFLQTDLIEKTEEEIKSMQS